MMYYHLIKWENLSYSHYVELLPYDCDLNKIKYYIKMVEEQKLGIGQLRKRIKNKVSNIESIN